jgi:hypothetical protein
MCWGCWIPTGCVLPTIQVKKAGTDLRKEAENRHPQELVLFSGSVCARLFICHSHNNYGIYIKPIYHTVCLIHHGIVVSNSEEKKACDKKVRTIHLDTLTKLAFTSSTNLQLLLVNQFSFTLTTKHSNSHPKYLFTFLLSSPSIIGLITDAGCGR